MMLAYERSGISPKLYDNARGNQNRGKWLTLVRSEQRRQPFSQGEKQQQTRRDHRRR